LLHPDSSAHYLFLCPKLPPKKHLLSTLLAPLKSALSQTVGITVNQPTVAAAQNEANSIINAITTSVENLGVDEQDIKTINFSVNPNYDYEVQPPVIQGYNVSTSVRITVTDLEQINQVIDTATNNGANQINNIAFTLSRDKEMELREQARQEAIDDAKQSAKELANLAGMRLGKIIDIKETIPGTPEPPIMFARNEAMALDSAEPTNVQPGSATYNYQITLSYETL
jgi:uncharacterized protein YggE